jgi:GT2 family glycosyltransferase
MPIAITGMHGCGTSMVAHVLELAGVYFGDEVDLEPRAEDGDRSWEHASFVGLNDEILQQLGGEWKKPPVVPRSFAEDKRLKGLKGKAERLVREFDGREPWAWTDPRNSLTIGLWAEIVPNPAIIVCLRNPLEVAIALRRTTKLTYSKVLGLWETYYRGVLDATTPDQRIVTDYESYFSRARTELGRVLDFAGVAPNRSSLRHLSNLGKTDRSTKLTVQDLLNAGLAPDIVELYLWLRGEAGLRDSGKRRREQPAPTSDRGGPPVDDAALDLVDLRQRVSELESIVNGREPETPVRLDDRLLRAVEELQSSVYDLRADSDPAKAEYGRLVRRVQEAVRESVPMDSTVLVASKGDNDLLKLYGRESWHFPRTETGVYAGYYPKCDLSAIAHLETLRARGAEYLVLPSTAFWWLDHYPRFKAHVEDRYLRVVREEDDDVCKIFELRLGRRSLSWQGEVRELLNDYSVSFGRRPSVLDWNTGLDLAGAFPEHTVFSPGTQNGLPYLDGTIDIVAMRQPKGRAGALAEAQRVASAAVLVLSGDSSNGLQVDARWTIQRADPPSASVVVPCFDGIEHTRACLKSLRETLPSDFRGEIVVVDDASTDGTAQLLDDLAELDERILVVRHSRNRGFLDSANSGAEAASSDVLVFLNNDTVLLPGWLEPLLHVFTDHDDAGAVGGRLLYPDGRLQEAGGLVFADGSAWKYGYGDSDPSAPLYSFFREADYCSGCLLATRRSLFADLGGFDARYKPGFYEDTDYCFAVHERGLGVYYEPQSTIVHVEGATAGTDLGRGPKRHQVANGRKFTAKWRKALKKLPERPDALDGWSLAPLVNARSESR